MVIDFYARQIKLDAPLFYISVPFPKPEDLELVFTVRRSAPISPFSVWTQPPNSRKFSRFPNPHCCCVSWICIIHRLLIPLK